MNSSLLPNDIQDIEGMELHDQVKTIRDYIEYMREQLQWYAGVTGKAEGDFVQSVTTYYGVSSSPTTPPSSWSTECPQLEDGEYLWEYTKVKRSGITTRSEPVCITTQFEDGEDAAIVYIHSSNGTIFRADNTGTVLTISIYYGSDAIRTLANLQVAFGASAHLDWYERAYGSNTDTPISPSDSRISGDGFTLTLTNADVANRATYTCHLMLDVLEERAQSSITITDIEDGVMLYATSSTAGSTAAKTATLSSGSLDLVAGAMVAVTFEHANTAANPTLNIDSTGAKTIRAADAALSASSKYNWTDDATVIFIYDGTYWQMDGTAQLEKADDARKVATNYITDVTVGGEDGIEVTGNTATAKVQITDKVRVQADSTHFSETTDSQFKIHAGNATTPAAYLGAEEAALAGDGTGKYFVKISKETTAFDDQVITNGGVLCLYSTGGVVKAGIVAGSSGTQYFNNAVGEKIVRIGANKTGIGSLEIWNGAEENNKKSAELTNITIINDYETLVNNEPALVFYDAGEGGSERMSWYSKRMAYIKDNDHEGFVVYGNTPEHGYTIDYLSSGRINFYVDGVSIGYATITSSDERMKTNIEPIDNCFKRAVQSVELKNFNYNFNDATRAGANLQKRFGVIAQDVIRALKKEGINYENSDLVETDDKGEYYTVNYVPFLIARLAADEDRIKELETRLDAITNVKHKEEV